MLLHSTPLLVYGRARHQAKALHLALSILIIPVLHIICIIVQRDRIKAYLCRLHLKLLGTFPTAVMCMIQKIVISITTTHGVLVVPTIRLIELQATPLQPLLLLARAR